MSATYRELSEDTKTDKIWDKCVFYCTEKNLRRLSIFLLISLSNGFPNNVLCCLAVCCHSTAGICNRVCGGGAGLHLQGKGNHCVIGLQKF